MTALLESVIDKAARLPKAAQEQLAAQWLVEVEAELKWDHTLAASQPLLEKLAKKARAARRAGKTTRKGFDEL